MVHEERLLTIDEAYAALLRFLELFRSTLRDATVVDVLSEGALAAPRETVDPGVWGTWLEALNGVTDDAFAQMRATYGARWQR
jgi:hypothetical protein